MAQKIHARRAHRRKNGVGDYINATLCNREMNERWTTVLADRVTCAHCIKQMDMREDAEAQWFMSPQNRVTYFRRGSL